ncbi:hypothetical protein B0H15DRAFT_497534 [Mycena belliarum]|uniref:Uncharacterized protein n=1 Tax=Mycena belliarum TaxID=1033014 RepID=A0AAD6XLH2_9AGAR|nr:hypothetical protein B0H15DRAFT_497534 [Mycena belliae]
MFKPKRIAWRRYSRCSTTKSMGPTQSHLSSVVIRLNGIYFLFFTSSSDIIWESSRKARKVILSRRELTSAIDSVTNIFESVHFRITNLETSHLQQAHDPYAEISRFGFGMYTRTRWGPPTSFGDLHGLCSETSDDEVPEIETAKSCKDRDSEEVDCVNPFKTTATLTPEQQATGRCWTGHLQDRTGNITSYGMIEVLLDSSWSGNGSYSAGTLTVSGTQGPESVISLSLSGLPDDPTASRFDITFQGRIQNTADDHSTIFGD